MLIGLIVVATGKYDRFVPQLWSSARQFLLPKHHCRLFLMTDHSFDLPHCECLHVPHEPWPGPTLHRYRHVCTYADRFQGLDYLLQSDADMRFVNPVGEEILGSLVATVHPGFFDKPRTSWTYERRGESRAQVPPGRGRRYYCGGFQGGAAKWYLAAAREIDAAIKADECDGITAVWHDESHWNRYLIDRPPTVELSPSYCYPEGWSLPFEPKLLALSKDHAAIRS
jgi:histo-blood group ABO system transferase